MKRAMERGWFQRSLWVQMACDLSDTYRSKIAAGDTSREALDSVHIEPGKMNGKETCPEFFQIRVMQTNPLIPQLGFTKRTYRENCRAKKARTVFM